MDDDPHVRQLLKTLLTIDGCVVDLAEDADIAGKLLKTRSYDFILSDLVLPNQTGLEFVKGLRAAGLATSVLIISGTFDTETRTACADLKEVDCLDKPFNLGVLREAIRKLLT